MAATVVLGLSPLGFATVPGLGGAITLLHLPMILAATLESPLAAGLVGATFGIVAGFKFDTPPFAFHVAVRVAAGITAGIAFQAISHAANEGSKVTVASAVTAVVGSASNTVYMCFAVLFLGLAEPSALLSVAVVHGAIELALALIVTTPLTILLKGNSE